MEQLGHDEVGDRVVDRCAEEDDPLLQQPREDVVGALTPVRLLDHIGHRVVTSVHASSAGVSGVGFMSSARSMILPSSSAISTCSVSHVKAFPFLISERTAGSWSLRSSCLRMAAGFCPAACAMRSISA